MTFVKTLSLLVILAILTNSTESGRPVENVDPMREKFNQWIVTFGRVYKDNADKEQRFLIFKNNVESIEEFNRGNHTYTQGVNQFTDISRDEFIGSFTGLKAPSLTSNTSSYESFMFGNVSEVPPSIDWRLKGAVTPVKNQGKCGSCWAFSAVAAMEGLTKLETSKITSLSEQELVDCDTKGKDHGCDGGLMDSAFEFIISKGGLVSDSKYPYKGIAKPCNNTAASNPTFTIGSYQKVPSNNEKALQKVVANQPVSAGIEVSGSFQFYSKGVFTGDCDHTSLNHAVTIVGYGSTNGTKYWLVKNSWGDTWGEKGYIRMERDVKGKEGLCGIALVASYPAARKTN